MSTIGAVPAPLSGTDGLSARRGSPSRSVVVPAGSEALLPASAQGETGERCRSPVARLTKSGSLEMLPVPPTTPCTQLGARRAADVVEQAHRAARAVVEVEDVVGQR